MLEAVAHRIVRESKRKAILTGIVAAFAFMVMQTAVTLVGARLISGGSQALADRVDRNVIFTACVLAIDPKLRTSSDIVRCMKEANVAYDIRPVPPVPKPSPAE